MKEDTWHRCYVKHDGVTVKATERLQSCIKHLLVLTIIKWVCASYLMRAVRDACFCSSLVAALEDWGLEDMLEEAGGSVEERRDDGRRLEEEEGAAWLAGFFPLLRKRSDLTLTCWMMLWLLRRCATFPTGPVPDLLKVCSDLKTKKQRDTAAL